MHLLVDFGNEHPIVNNGVTRIGGNDYSWRIAEFTRLVGNHFLATYEVVEVGRCNHAQPEECKVVEMELQRDGHTEVVHLNIAFSDLTALCVLDLIFLTDLDKRRCDYKAMTNLIVPVRDTYRRRPKRELSIITCILAKALIDREWKIHTHEHPVRFNVLRFAEVSDEKKKYEGDISYPTLGHTLGVGSEKLIIITTKIRINYNEENPTIV